MSSQGQWDGHDHSPQTAPSGRTRANYCSIHETTAHSLDACPAVQQLIAERRGASVSSSNDISSHDESPQPSLIERPPSVAPPVYDEIFRDDSGAGGVVPPLARDYKGHRASGSDQLGVPAAAAAPITTSPQTGRPVGGTLHSTLPSTHTYPRNGAPPLSVSTEPASITASALTAEPEFDDVFESDDEESDDAPNVLDPSPKVRSTSIASHGAPGPSTTKWKRILRIKNASEERSEPFPAPHSPEQWPHVDPFPNDHTATQNENRPRAYTTPSPQIVQSPVPTQASLARTSTTHTGPRPITSARPAGPRTPVPSSSPRSSSFSNNSRPSESPPQLAYSPVAMPIPPPVAMPPAHTHGPQHRRATASSGTGTIGSSPLANTVWSSGFPQPPTHTPVRRAGSSGSSNGRSPVDRKTDMPPAAYSQASVPTPTVPRVPAPVKAQSAPSGGFPLEHTDTRHSINSLSSLTPSTATMPAPATKRLGLFSTKKRAKSTSASDMPKPVMGGLDSPPVPKLERGAIAIADIVHADHAREADLGKFYPGCGACQRMQAARSRYSAEKQKSRSKDSRKASSTSSAGSTTPAPLASPPLQMTTVPTMLTPATPMLRSASAQDDTMPPGMMAPPTPAPRSTSDTDPERSARAAAKRATALPAEPQAHALHAEQADKGVYEPDCEQCGHVMERRARQTVLLQQHLETEAKKAEIWRAKREKLGFVGGGW